MEFDGSPSINEPFNRSECPWALLHFTKKTKKDILKLDSNLLFFNFTKIKGNLNHQTQKKEAQESPIGLPAITLSLGRRPIKS